ncbi:uncharacterized protein LOC128196094 [Vigna angularis]|uniref:uncharacterized protein LOC128196094 n=1 Tax=Phaseolus angularis TaxID=3914 RepID=UPI0022B39863|nr:uncharacterized protein LOC128196094 [Vigna angularis]
MSVNVTFFEQTPYFSPSVQDVSILQQVLPIPMAESNSSTVFVNPSLDHNPPTLVSPHTEIIPHRAPMDSPPPQDNGESPTSDSSPSSPLPTPPGENDSSWPIALRKVFSVVIPKNVKEALDHPGWRQAMIAEMQALDHSNTWELVPLPQAKRLLIVDGCMQLKLALMVKLIGSKLGLLQKVTLRFMVLIIVTLFLL